MGFFRWVYRRIGQMLCFSVGPFLVYAGSLSYAPPNQAFAGAGLLIAGLVLRHQMERRRRDEEWRAWLGEKMDEHDMLERIFAPPKAE